MFAKLFDRDGEQVLVSKDVDYENGNPYPAILFTFEVGGRTIKYKLSYNTQQARDVDFVKCDDNKAFEVKAIHADAASIL